MIRLTRLLTGAFSEKLPHKIAVWNLTTACNLSCKHCYIDARTKGEDELKRDEAFSVIKELASLDFKVILFSGGEPLLYPDLFELNSYAKACGIKTCLSSNGSLITESLAIKIKDADFEYVGISIDGTREIHDRFRGIPGAFDKALNGLRVLKKYNVKRGIRLTLNKENIESLEDVIEISLKEGIERFCLYHLVPTGRGRENMDIGNAERKRVIEYLVQKITAGMKMEVLTVCNPSDGILLLQNNKGAEKHLSGCSAGMKIINIAPNGDVYPCQFFKKPLGNIKKSALSTILKNDFIGLLNDKKNLKARCGMCDYKELCGGCRVRAYARTSDYFGEDTACYITPSV